MSSMKVMGIDIGTTTVSVIMIDGETGKSMGTKTIAHEGFLQSDRPGAKLQDPQKLLEITQTAVQELIDELGSPKSIGLTGQMHGMLYVDASGNAVSPAYIWQDGSGNERLEQDVTYADYLRRAGGAAASGYGLVTHYYLQTHDLIPKEAVKMTTISDYIGMKLCGRTEPVIAVDMAASWGCFDLEKEAFFTEALEALGVELRYLPKVLKEHEIMGCTKDGIPVMVSLGDNQASALGSVKDLCHTVLLNIGTGSQISIGTERFAACEGSVELRPCVEGTRLLVGAGLCGGRAYAMLEQFYREAAQSEDALYEQMEQQASAFLAAYGKEEVWKIRTTFSGTRSNPDERGSITNLGVENFHPGAMTAGMICGVLEELWEMYSGMKTQCSGEPIYLVGSGNGIRRNRLMRRLAEEMYGMKMMIPVCKEEAAYGAALYSMVAAGLADSLEQVQNRIQYE